MQAILFIKRFIHGLTYQVIGMTLVGFLLLLAAFSPSLLFLGKNVHDFMRVALYLSGGLFSLWLIVFFVLHYVTSFLSNDLIFYSLDTPSKFNFWFSIAKLFNKKLIYYSEDKSFLNFLAASKNWSEEKIQYKKHIFDYIIKQKYYQNTSIDALYLEFNARSHLIMWILNSDCDDTEFLAIKKALLNFDFIQYHCAPYCEEFLKYCLEHNIFFLPSERYKGDMTLFHLVCEHYSTFTQSLKDIVSQIPVDIHYTTTSGMTYFHYLHDGDIADMEHLLSYVNVENQTILSRLDESFTNLLKNNSKEKEILSLIEKKKMQLEKEKLEQVIVKDTVSKRKTIKI